MTDYTPEQLAVRRAKAIAWNRAHRDVVRARSKAYYLAHQAAIQRKARVYARKHKDANNARQIEWRKQYPWYAIWQQARSRATKAGIDYTLTKEDMRYLWVRDVDLETIAPTLCRINDTLGFTLDNCRLIPKSDAARVWMTERHRAKSES